MEITNAELIAGRHYRLLKPVQNRHRLSHFNERPRILRELDNLDKHMYLVRSDNRCTALLFQNEVAVE